MNWKDSLNEWWPWRTKVLTPQSQEAAEAAFEAGWERGRKSLTMNREETHKKLIELRGRAARQPISYKPLFDEAADLAADLLHELCEMDVGMPPRAAR